MCHLLRLTRYRQVVNVTNFWPQSAAAAANTIKYSFIVQYFCTRFLKLLRISMKINTNLNDNVCMIRNVRLQFFFSIFFDLAQKCNQSLGGKERNHLILFCIVNYHYSHIIGLQVLSSLLTFFIGSVTFL